jgi:hypothetical protein
MQKVFRSNDMSDRPSLEEWLEKIPPDLQTITRQLIAVARRKMPKAHEFIYHDAVGYSINDSPFDRICYIAPQQKGYVNFGFFFGARLADPKQLLEGEGKRIRHVKVWTVEDAKSPALAKLIAATWQEAPQRVAEVHAGMKKIKAK